MYYSGFSVLYHKARFVYYYENGKEYKEKMNLPISNESYNTALEYIKAKQLKEVNFMQYVFFFGFCFYNDGLMRMLYNMMNSCSIGLFCINLPRKCVGDIYGLGFSHGTTGS